MSNYGEWKTMVWKLTSVTPDAGSTDFGLTAGKTLKFEGDGTEASKGKVSHDGAPWGENCVFSVESGIETIQGTRCGTRQPFKITRPAGQRTHSGVIYRASVRPLRYHHDPTHGNGSSCGVWTASDG